MRKTEQPEVSAEMLWESPKAIKALFDSGVAVFSEYFTILRPGIAWK